MDHYNVTDLSFLLLRVFEYIRLLSSTLTRTSYCTIVVVASMNTYSSSLSLTIISPTKLALIPFKLKLAFAYARVLVRS